MVSPSPAAPHRLQELLLHGPGTAPAPLLSSGGGGLSQYLQHAQAESSSAPVIAATVDGQAIIPSPPDGEGGPAGQQDPPGPPPDDPLQRAYANFVRLTTAQHGPPQGVDAVVEAIDLTQEDTPVPAVKLFEPDDPPSSSLAAIETTAADLPAPSYLVVGDGNLTNSAQLAAAGHCLCATIWDTAQEADAKFGAVYREAVATIRRHGGEVLHGVDACCLNVHFPARRFAVVRFNFPHPGHQTGTFEDARNRSENHAHLSLIRHFLLSAATVLARGGTVYLVVRKTPHVYSHEEVQELIAASGFAVQAQTDYRATYAMAHGDHRDVLVSQNERRAPSFGLWGVQYQLGLQDPSPASPPPAEQAPYVPVLPMPLRNMNHQHSWSHPCYRKGYQLLLKMREDPNTATDREAREDYMKLKDLVECNGTNDKRKRAVNALLREWGPKFGFPG